MSGWFVDVDVNEWCVRHGLEVFSVTCEKCGSVVTADRPYESDTFVAVVSETGCPCGAQSDIGEFGEKSKEPRGAYGSIAWLRGEISPKNFRSQRFQREAGLGGPSRIPHRVVPGALPY